MKVLVTYHSDTGNTKKVAQSIYEAIEEPKQLSTYDQIEDVNGFDLIFVGFPVHQFGASQAAKDFVAEKLKNRKIVLFATHSMSKKSPRLGTQIENCKKVAEGNELLGLFTCRGELSEEIANFLLNSDDKQLQQFGKMRKGTIGHPNQEELSDAAVFAKDIMIRFK